jgi:hypothetical protein
MGLDLSAIKNENKRLESQGQSNFIENFVPMPEGEGSVIVRLLPPRDGVTLPFCITRTHKMNGKNFHCLQSFINSKWVGNCPVCNYYKYLWRESDGVSEEHANELRAEARVIKPIERYYYNAIVRSFMNKNGETETNVGPKILSIGKQLHSKIIRAMCGDSIEEELGDVTDVTGATGRDLKIIKRLVKSGNESYPNYTESRFAAPSRAGTDKQIEEWLDNLHNLEDLRQLKTVEELTKEVRIFRKLEKDPSLEYDSDGEVSTTEEVTPKKVIATATVKTPVNSMHKGKTIATPPPLLDDDDVDSALADDDFLKKLRDM